MTKSKVYVGYCSWRSIKLLLIVIHSVPTLSTGCGNQELERGNAVELVLSCISTTPSVTYSRNDSDFAFYRTIIHYTCIHPNGTVVADNEVLVSNTAFSITSSLEHMVEPGTNCTFWGCYDSPDNFRLRTITRAIEPSSCITDSADECLETAHNNCSVGNAVCINTIGSYECICKEGYDGNGIHCENINECDRGLDNCTNNAVCTDTEGGYTCDCKDGYEGNGYLNCTNINECDRGLDNCTDNAVCTDTEGGYTCDCTDGYEGIGYLNCTKVTTGVTELNTDSGVATSKTHTPSHSILIPLTGVLLVIVVFVVVVVVLNSVIKAKRKPRMWRVYDLISKKDTLDNDYCPTDPYTSTVRIKRCPSEISNLNGVLEPPSYTSVTIYNRLDNSKELFGVTHSKIDTNPTKLNGTGTLHTQLSERDSTCSDDIPEVTAVETTHQSSAEQPCTYPQQNQSNIEHLTISCNLTESEAQITADGEPSHVHNNITLTAPNMEELNPSQERDCISPVSLGRTSTRDDSGTQNYYTDSEGYIKFYCKCNQNQEFFISCQNSSTNRESSA